MTRGSKIILSLMLIAAILLSVIVISSLAPSLLALERLSKITTIVGFLIALGALVVATAEYYRKKDIDAKESRPYVTASLEPKEGSQSIFNIRVENTGKTIARDVSVKFTPDYRPFDSAKSMNELGVLDNLGIMASNEKRKFFFGNYMNPDGDRSIRREFKIKVSYTDITSKYKFSETFLSNPTDYNGMFHNHQKGLNDIHKLLDKFVNTHKESVQSQKKLQETIVEKGVRIRNLNSTGKNKDSLLNLVTNTYDHHSKDEFWLNPFIYDFKLIIRQCRDEILTQDKLNGRDGAIVAELNSILEKDWHYDTDEIEAHFKALVDKVRGIHD